MRNSSSLARGSNSSGLLRMVCICFEDRTIRVFSLLSCKLLNVYNMRERKKKEETEEEEVEEEEEGGVVSVSWENGVTVSSKSEERNIGEGWDHEFSFGCCKYEMLVFFHMAIATE
jgi:hypothetical protein